MMLLAVVVTFATIIVVNFLLSQFYTNRVIINGSLIVNNLKRENNTTKIILGDQEFDENEIKEKYLLRDQEQVHNL